MHSDVSIGSIRPSCNSLLQQFALKVAEVGLWSPTTFKHTHLLML